MSQEEEILEHLTRLHFTDEDLHNRIKENIRLGIPYFTVHYTAEYPEGRIQFEFICCKEQSERSQYYLLDYSGILTKNFTLPRELINGISAEILDATMSEIDWPTFIKETNNGAISAEESENVAAMVKNLWQLTANDDSKGKEVQDYLRIKHWGNTDWNDPELSHQSVNTDRTFTFNPEEKYLLTQELCYYILTGKYQEMLEKQQSIGFDSPIYLQRTLSQNLPEFDLHFYKYFEQDIVHYKLHYEKDDSNNFNLTDYSAVLMGLPDIDHKEIYEIDTADLESEMECIDWLDEESHYLDLDEDPCFTEEISDILSIMSDLAASDPVSCRISFLLQLKYWLESPDFSNMIEDGAWAILESQPKVDSLFPANVHSEQAYHLLCGRSVYIKEEGMPYWLLLGNGDNIDNKQLQKVYGFGPDELKKVLEYLPCTEQSIQASLPQLLRGHRVKMDIDTQRYIYVEADPQKATIKLFSSEGTPIFTNLLLLPGELQIIHKPTEAQKLARINPKPRGFLIRTNKKKRGGKRH